jgi:hypothetical protein
MPKKPVKPLLSKPVKPSKVKKLRKQKVKEISEELDNGIDSIRFLERKQYKNHFKKKKSNSVDGLEDLLLKL